MKTTLQSNRDALLSQPWAQELCSKNLEGGMTVLQLDGFLCRTAQLLGYEYMSVLDGLACASLLSSPYLNIRISIDNAARHIDVEADVTDREKSWAEIAADVQKRLNKNTRIRRKTK